MVSSKLAESCFLVGKSANWACHIKTILQFGINYYVWLAARCYVKQEAVGGSNVPCPNPTAPASLPSGSTWNLWSESGHPARLLKRYSSPSRWIITFEYSHSSWRVGCPAKSCCGSQMGTESRFTAS
jgi:hypothetical protein